MVALKRTRLLHETAWNVKSFFSAHDGTEMRWATEIFFIFTCEMTFSDVCSVVKQNLSTFIAILEQASNSWYTKNHCLSCYGTRAGTCSYWQQSIGPFDWTECHQSYFFQPNSALYKLSLFLMFRADKNELFTIGRDTVLYCILLRFSFFSSVERLFVLCSFVFNVSKVPVCGLPWNDRCDNIVFYSYCCVIE